MLGVRGYCAEINPMGGIGLVKIRALPGRRSKEAEMTRQPIDTRRPGAEDVMEFVC